MDRGEPALVEVGRVESGRLLLIAAASASVLPPATGAEIDHLLAGFAPGEQRCNLRAFVLDLDQPLDERPARHGSRAFGFAASNDAQSKNGDQRVGVGARSASDATCRRRVRP